MKAILQSVTRRSVGLVALEAALITGTILVAVVLRIGHEGLASEWLLPTLGRGALIALVCQFCLYVADLYDMKVVRSHRELVIRSIQAMGAAALILSVVYYWFPTLTIGRGVFAIAAGLVALMVVGLRLCWEWLSQAVGPRERLLIIGTGSAAVALCKELTARPELGIEVVGLVSSADRSEQTAHAVPVLGSVHDVPALVRQHNVDRVVVSLVDARGRLPMDKLLDMKMSGVAFDHLASVYEEYTGKIAVENLRPSWLIFSSGFKKSTRLVAAKRTLDIVAASLGLILGLPIMLLTAIAVRLTSPGPILYHQVRVGLGGRHFTVHKFRSMRTDAERGNAVWAQRNDPRVTPIGRLMRKARLDEMPQLWNILRGDMSFVGPRPERPEFVDDLTEQIPFYGQRHVVKPGLTGWAQVSYTYGASVEDTLEKLQYDLFYIKHMAVSFDIFIMFQTMKTVLLRRGT